MRNNRLFVRCLCSFLLLTVLAVFSFSAARAAEPEGGSGRELFLQKCGNCHGEKGEGFLKVYPPIRNSSFLHTEISQLPCIMRYGLSGKITVGGTVFNQRMPGDPKISGEEIERLIKYMQQSWGYDEDELHVEQWLDNCNARQ